MTPPALRNSASSSVAGTLGKLLPPQTLVHVGAGSGSGPLHFWHDWQIPEVWLVDANPERLAWAGKHPNWHTVGAVVAGQDEVRTFHQASNPDEAGLIPPQQLQALWPSLKSRASEEHQTQPLATLLQQSDTASGHCWLLVDCLPALPILHGAGSWLQQASVLWLRTLLQPLEGLEEEGTTLQELQDYLQALGFRLLETTTGNHPALGHALFARDWHGILQSQQQKQAEEIKAGELVLQALSRELEARNTAHAEEKVRVEFLEQKAVEFAKQASERQVQIEQLTKARDEQAKVATDRHLQLEALSKVKTALENEKNTLTANLDELQKQVATITQARDSHSKLATDLQAQILQLTNTKDEQAKLAADCFLHLDAINKDKIALEQEKSIQTAKLEELQKQIFVLTEARDSQAKLAVDRQTQIEQVANERNNLREQLTLLTQTQTGQTKQAEEIKAELVKAQSAVSKANARIEEMEAELAERDTRQQMLNDEITRAEAQIELIKDVLLREPGL